MDVVDLMNSERAGLYSCVSIFSNEVAIVGAKQTRVASCRDEELL
jgi:hypothetical protein